MVLISDTGGTSSDWALIDQNKTITQFSFGGYNPVTNQESGLDQILQAVHLKIQPFIIGNKISDIYYYGTGIISLAIEGKIKNKISAAITSDQTHVHSDINGAVKASCGKEKGIVVIQGTGSNVCQYDGRKIESLTPSLGFPLGDEGSGSDIGKRLIKAYYYHELSAEIAAILTKLLPEERSEFILNFKHHKAPNQYVASFAKVAIENLHYPIVKSIVRESLYELFNHHISKYERSLPLYFVGSIAYHCQAFIKQIAEEKGFMVNKFVKSPLEGLIQYHKNDLKYVK